MQLETSTDFQTVESSAPDETVDGFAKSYPGSFHPAVSRAFRFEMSEGHKAENTRLTGIESRRHIAPFQCITNPEELIVSVTALRLDKERLTGRQAIVTKIGDSPIPKRQGTLKFYALSDEPQDLDQNL